MDASPLFFQALFNVSPQVQNNDDFTMACLFHHLSTTNTTTHRTPEHKFSKDIQQEQY